MLRHFSAGLKTARGGKAMRRMLGTASGVALLALAGYVAPAAAQDGEGAEQVVVTGSRVIRDGSEAPTPVTVLGEDQIKDAATPNIAEFVDTLPSLVGNTSPQTARTSMTAGGTGLNTPQARNLGSSRTLILLDGKRSVGSQATGQVDINTFPQQLISRVEVVTGGASAVYGSDALAGVINFVLDHNYTGLKGELQGGLTNYGDDPTWDASLTWGTPFAGGRGHLLVSGELSDVDGIKGAPRDWARQGWHVINNPAYTPTNGLPQRLVLPHTAQTVMTPGGIITAGPLAGTAFGPGGTPYQFNYGPIRLDPWMQGGEWQANDYSAKGADLDPVEKRSNIFTRLTYNLTDNIEVYGQYSNSHDISVSTCCQHFAAGDLTIQVDNAFMPAQVHDAMVADHLTSIKMGSYFSDLPNQTTQIARRTVRRYLLGADGNFDLFGSNWQWDAYYQQGETGVVKTFYDRFKSKYVPAIDAVRDPSSGAIVCRSTLTNPNNGCVPWDVFGTGVNTAAAANYIAGWSYAHEVYRQSVSAVSFTGQPFSTWAGPVSMAFGVEHRQESVGGTQSPSNAANDSFIGNSAPTIGHYAVTEGFIETDVPLARDEWWARSLEFNGAVRATDYTTSGYVTTWKAGLSYQPIDDLRFRFTQSLDIRAPNNVELFAAGIYVGNLVNDPFRGGVPTNIQSLTSGNPDLKPEKADTTGLGAIYRPSWFPGFSASADYYHININDVIGTVGRQQVPDRCFAGETSFCASLVFDSNGILSIVKTVPTNFIKQVNEGVDYEVSYMTGMDTFFDDVPGDLMLRGLATNYIKILQDDGSGIGLQNQVGGSTRDWKYSFSATYSLDAYRFTLMGRGVSAGVYSVNNIECNIGCPAATSANPTVNDNHQPGTFYLDTSLRYDFAWGSTDMEAYFNVRNIFNTDPGITAQGPAGTAHSTPPCNAQFYDCLGRVYRIGLRFQM